jgi:hypothetical protein
LVDGELAMLDDRIFEGFLSRIAQSLEGIQSALEEINNTQRLSYDFDIDSRAKTNALTDEMATTFKGMLPALSGLLGNDPEEN